MKANHIAVENFGNPKKPMGPSSVSADKAGVALDGSCWLAFARKSGALRPHLAVSSPFSSAALVAVAHSIPEVTSHLQEAEYYAALRRIMYR